MYYISLRRWVHYVNYVKDHYNFNRNIDYACKNGWQRKSKSKNDDFSFFGCRYKFNVDYG